MELLDLLDPTLLTIAALLVPFLTELFTQAGAGPKVKDKVATVLTAAVIAVDLILQIFVTDDLDIATRSEVYDLAFVIVAGFGLARATVWGGHKGIDAIEKSTGRSIDNVTLPSFGLRAPDPAEEYAGRP